MTSLLSVLLTLNVFAPFLGSWLPPLAGSPAGGIIRDLTILLFITCTFFLLLKSQKMPHLHVAYLVVWLWSFCWMTVLVATGGQISAGVLGARNLICFPLVGLLALVNIRIGAVSPESVKKCIYILGFLAAILGILDVVTDGKILVMLGYRKDYADGDLFNLVVEYLGFRRASGGLADSLNYGYTMSLFTVYFLYGLLTSKDVQKTKIAMKYLLFSLSAVAVVLSLTRGAILVTVIGMILFVFRLGSKRFKLLFLFSFIIGTLTFALSDYGELLYGRFTDSEKVSAQSSQSRIDMASQSFEVIANNPFGIGLGTQGAGTKFISDDMRVDTDNFFLWVSLESGVVGLMLLFTTAVLNFVICFRSSRSNKHLFLLCLYMAIAYFLTGMLSSAQVSPLYSILFWVIINVECSDFAVRRHRQETEGYYATACAN